MQKNSGDFSVQDAMRLANSPAGQQLLALLQQADPQSLQAAINRASAGDLNQAKEALGPLLALEEVKKLLQQLGG